MKCQVMETSVWWKNIHIMTYQSNGQMLHHHWKWWCLRPCVCASWLYQGCMLSPVSWVSDEVAHLLGLAQGTQASPTCSTPQTHKHNKLNHMLEADMPHTPLLLPHSLSTSVPSNFLFLSCVHHLLLLRLFYYITHSGTAWRPTYTTPSLLYTGKVVAFVLQPATWCPA